MVRFSAYLVISSQDTHAVWFYETVSKETYCIVSFRFIPVLQCVTYILVSVKDLVLEVQKVKVGPTEAPLSHRKHCSWNASSVVQHFISLTLWHHTEWLSHIFYALQLVWHIPIDLAQLLCCAGSDACELTNHRRLGILGGGGGLKQSISSRGGNTVLHHWTAWACKPD